MPKPLTTLPSGTEIRIAIKANAAHEIRSYSQIGFAHPPKVGDTILPSGVGAATRKNAEGHYLIHKDREKVPRTFELATRRSQFCGRGQREIVEDYHSYTKLCWQRTLIKPSNIELSYIKGDDGNFYYVSPILKSGQDDDAILMAINVFLELFQLCHICEMEKGGLPVTPIRRVNWELLRPGTGPSRGALNQLINSIPKKAQRHLAKRQFDLLHEFHPTELAIGQGGFNGYVAFRFEELGLTVLESIQPNNATYLFGDDWKEFSQLTKQEVLSGHLQIERIIHNKGWLKHIKYFLLMKKSA